jgi:hypothetical protein
LAFPLQKKTTNQFKATMEKMSSGHQFVKLQKI